MKKVLFIAYYFPPVGGSGVQRSAKFVKYLRGAGWEPVVLTVAEETARRDGLHSADESLLADIPAGTEILRTHPGDRFGVRQRLWDWHLLGAAQFVFYPWFWERQAMWYRPCLRTARQRLARGDIDAIYTTSGPFTALRVGARLKRETGLPWVADLRDPYTQVNWGWPSRLHYRFCQRQEAALLRQADRVVVVSPGMRELFADDVPALRDRLEVVENGYDAADFPAPAPPPDAEAFRIAFVGSLQPPPLETAQRPPLRHRLNPLRRLRHAGPEALDRLPRQSPRFFLRGATAAVRERPALRDDLAIHFWGSVAEAEVAPDHLAALGLEANVFRHGPVPHGEAIRQMRAAQALLLTTDRRLDGRRSATVTGKLYEYMAARRPILVVGGDSDGADFAVRSGLGVHHLPEATDAIARTLLAWHDDWQGGQLTVRPREAFIAAFERRALTERLAGILDSVVRPPAHERTSA